MSKNLISFLACFFMMYLVAGQSIAEIINQVSLDSLQLTLREFTGEQTTIVNGNSVTIQNRVQSNNDLAADYLFEKLNGLNNLTVSNQLINGEAGRRNVIATQLGKTNPDAIYIVCAHYDSVADYCADDNASGTAAVLEIARLLSTQCLDNTIVYALWDEEEIGLVGSNYYATQAAANGDNILGVLNIDMMGYDGNNDNDFDIDVRDFGNSIAMKDDIVSILNNPTYGFTLNVNVVNPGTTASDHARFWNQGYTAVLVGESWETNDQTPFYHSSGDDYSTLNFPYYHELAKLITGYMVTKGGLLNIDNTVTQNASTLTASQSSATYQWSNCDTETVIAGATNQSYTPVVNGNYKVEITTGSCTEISTCFAVNTLGVEAFSIDGLKIFPNPVKTVLNIELPQFSKAELKIVNINGQVVLKQSIEERLTKVKLSALTNGIYFVNLKVDGKVLTQKIVKE